MWRLGFFGLIAFTIMAITILTWKLTPQPDVTASPTETISTLILPHHDLVKSLRQQFLAEMAQKVSQPQTIILISPNHYEVGIGKIQASDQAWQLTNQTIQPNLAILSQLAGQVSMEPGSFVNEHGIKTVLADIWTVFPQAKIVPLIFKSNIDQPTITALNQTLTAACTRCLLIASIDFSHYQPLQLANLHDQLTERVIDNLDIGSALVNAEVDSPPALALTILWAESHHTQKLVIFKHTNSDEISKTPDAESTSHYFAYYQAGAKVSPPKSVSFIIGGDMMFGRMIAHTFLASGLAKSLDKLGDRVFWGTDGSIINLEGPISATPVADNIDQNNLTFNFPLETIAALKSIKVKAASLGNNHSNNAGSVGLATTRQLLSNAGIKPIGGPGASDIDQIVSFTGNGLTLDVIGVHALVGQPDLTALIKKLKTDPTHRILIFPHWGVEYLPKHTALQESLAHSWIDAGADIVIGSHPHVIEDAEIYKNRPIFYSLGNLLFDQTFSPETQQGLIIAGELTDKEIRLFGLPVESTQLKPALMRGERKSKLLDSLYAPIQAFTKIEPAGRMIDIPYI